MGIRLAAATLFIMVLGWATTVAINTTRSDALVLQASTEMGTWAASRVSPSRETWDAIHEKLQEANRIRPAGATGAELLGLLMSPRTDSFERMSAGIEHFSRAL